MNVGGHVAASTILLLESVASAGDTISSILTGAGYGVTITADPDVALDQGASHQLVMFDVTSGSRSGIDICREFRALPAAVGVPVMAVTTTDEVEERIAYLEAGADDVMARPFDARELEARVEALLLRFQRSRDLAPVISSDGVTMTKAKRTVAVFSPKGGVGTTTIATNIAVAAASQRPDRVVLVDGALQFGNVAAHLNVDAKQTIADVVRDDAAMHEPELLRTYAARHDSGLHVLAAPTAPEAAEAITSTEIRLILRTALESYDFVVVDAGSRLDERTQAIFEAAETIILVVGPEIAALNAMRAMLEYVAVTAPIADKSIFVVNELFARQILKTKDVEGVLGSSVSLQLPYDPFLYLKAVNEGIPVVVDAPRSAPGERLVKLSQMAFGADSSVVPAMTESKRTAGLFRRRR
jgi:pilus assembly protein CpaE